METRYPILLLALLLAAGLSARGTTYYFSSSSGKDSYTSVQAQNPSTPWQTLAKLNSIFSILKPGDSVLLQAGSVFPGMLVVGKSGTAAQPIVLSAYGNGNAPVISGFTTLTGWVSVGGGIWQAPCTGCKMRVNMVTVADTLQPMGRYPNCGTTNLGYACIQSFVGTTSITDSHLGTPNWTSADLVVRKNRWVIERDSILVQSGTTISYQTGSTFPPASKFGYFIQNNIKTLDKNGEWYYDPHAVKMNYYSTTAPSGTAILAANTDTLVSFRNVQYFVINGISLQGSNMTSMSFITSNFITIQNCSIYFSGKDAIDTYASNNLLFNNVWILDTNNDAIFLAGNRNTVQNCLIKRTGIHPGMGTSLDSYLGIRVSGNNNTVQYNEIDSTGYTAIEFTGESNTISNNLVNYFCFTKDDGGGIYTWSGDVDSTHSRSTGWITNNIVLNGVTVPGGTDSSVAGIAHGIYLDENTTRCAVTGNTVAHCSAGIFFQDSRNISIANNTFYDNAGQIVVRHAMATGDFYGNEVTGNIAVSNVDTENVAVASSIGPSSALSSFAYWHNNKYAQITNNSVFFKVAFTDLNSTGSLASWQALSKQDPGSTLLPVSFLPYTINNLIGSNLYTKGSIITQFVQALLGSRVVVSTPVGAIDSGAWYVSHFTMNAPDNAHTMLVFLQQYPSPYTHLAPIVSIATTTPSSNNTVVFNTYGSNSNSSLVFQLQQSDPRFSITNIDLYQANVVPNDPSQNVIFQYNASKSNLAVPLSGTYQDAGGILYSGTVQVPPYGSILLIKKS